MMAPLTGIELCERVRWPHPLLEKLFLLDEVLSAVEAVLARVRERHPVR